MTSHSHLRRLVIFLSCTFLVSAQPKSSCATNGTTCFPPTWAPEWSLTYSTICQPSSPSYFLPPANQPWGLISLDWSVNKQTWNKNGLRNGTIEATSRENCRQIKALFPKTKCFIYHNMELALEAVESQRAVMYPPPSPYFMMQWADGSIYNEPGGPGDQFFWNFTTPAVRQYFSDSVLNSINYPETDGSFTDDVTGIPAEHNAILKNLNLSASDVARYQDATSVANQMLIDAAISAGKYIWQAFGDQDGVSSGPSQATCAAWMRSRCTAAHQLTATTQSIDKSNFNQSLASFLITRPPIGFFGFGWESDQRDWMPEFLWDVGTPSNQCTETSVGVFSRTWTYGVSTLDCNQWKAVIPAH